MQYSFLQRTETRPAPDEAFCTISYNITHQPLSPTASNKHPLDKLLCLLSWLMPSVLSGAKKIAVKHRRESTVARYSHTANKFASDVEINQAYQHLDSHLPMFNLTGFLTRSGLPTAILGIRHCQFGIRGLACTPHNLLLVEITLMLLLLLLVARRWCFFSCFASFS